MSRSRSLPIGALALGAVASLLGASASTAVPAPSPTPVTTITGRAVVDETGAPVTGMTVTVTAFAGADHEEADVQQVTLGADGTFSFSLSYAAEYQIAFGGGYVRPNPITSATAYDTPYVPDTGWAMAYPGKPLSCTITATPTSTWQKYNKTGGGQEWSGPYSYVECDDDSNQWYAPVYRFWSPKFNNAHFFTTDYAEASRIRKSDPNWTYEQEAFLALSYEDGRCEVGTPVYRFYSPVFQSHFYTKDAAEKAHVIANDRNWTYEGVAYCAFDTAQPGTVPLYRFWSPRFGKHFYTANEAEKNHIVANDRNWTYESIAYYVVAP